MRRHIADTNSKALMLLRPINSASLMVSAATAGVFLAALDQTVILTSIPEMLTDVHVSLAHLDDASWVVTGYLLGYVTALPLMGRVSDVYGRRRTYLLALGLFALGSLACAMARTLPWLVCARVVQALGGGATLPVTLALVADLFPAARRALPLGFVGAAAEAGGVAGPIYGAGIVQVWGWRWIFWINLPLAMLAALLVWWALPAPSVSGPGGFSGMTNGAARVPARSGVASSAVRALFGTLRWGSGQPRGQIDFPGALLFAASLTALTVGLSGASNPLTSSSPLDLWRAIPLTIIAIVIGAAFVWRQRHAVSPLLPLRLFSLRSFSAANAVNFLVGVALIAAMVDVPLFAATVLERSPLASGLALLRMTVCIPLAAVAGGWLTHRFGARVTGVVGLICSAAGFHLMSGWSLQVSDAAMTPGLVLAGAGFGLVVAPVTFAALAGINEGDRALASALVTVMRMVGMTVGLAALTSLAFFRFNQQVAHLQLPFQRMGETTAAYAQRLGAYEAALSQAGLVVFTGIFAVATGICLVDCLFALFLPGRKLAEQ